MLKNISNTTPLKCWIIILTLILIQNPIVFHLVVSCMKSFMGSILFKVSLPILTSFMKCKKDSLGSLLGGYSSRLRKGRKLRNC